MSRLQNFQVDAEDIQFRMEAMPRWRCDKIRWKGRAIAHLTQGVFRAYLFPVYSPSGVSLTTESPVDHPHHNSMTISADVFFVKFPPLATFLSTVPEEATYNFYMNYIYQGRAPGRIWVTGTESDEISEGHLRTVQSLEWQGPEEWGVLHGATRRVLAEETRTIDIYPGEIANVIDIRSQLRPTEWDVTIGPTRHAYFTVRLEDRLRPINGGRVVDSEGRVGASEITGNIADWVDMSGPAPHNQKAGITVIPHPSAGRTPWYCSDYGTITVDPFLTTKGVLNRGEELDLGFRVLAHDGDHIEAGVADMYESFKKEMT